MNRRGFLKAILAAGVAPYVITTAGVLMPVKQIQVSLNPLFTGELGTYDDIVIRYMLPLSGNGISGDSALSGNEQILSIMELSARVKAPLVGDTIVVGKLPHVARIIHSNYALQHRDDGTLIRTAGG